MSSSPPLVVADRYRLIAPLGQGGMGRVWRATDVVLHREVAIKELVPPPGLTPGERQEMRERSLREARAIARLNNVNVVRVFDVLRTDADPWIVMEYVPSRSLQDTLAEDGPFSAVRVAEIGLGVLNALKAAHRAGVVHRDIKPGNVLMGGDGRVVLTDFGLATVPGDPNVTRTGLVLGSPAYIAPERARDGTAGPAADLWSLGATLYAAVEGQSPFARPSAIATLAALATENVPQAKNAGPLKPVLNGLLRKDPAHRIDADEAERLLARAAGRRSKLSFPMSPTMRRPGVGRERPSLPSGPGGPPVLPGSGFASATGSAPVVPTPRPPVTSRPADSPSRSQSGAQGNAPVNQGRANPPVPPGRPIFTPGKATVANPPPAPPARPGQKPLDQTKLDGPAVRDEPVNPASGTRGSATPNLSGTRQAPPRSGSPTGRATPIEPQRGAAPVNPMVNTARVGFTAADVAANRRKLAAPEHEASLAAATGAYPVVAAPDTEPDEVAESAVTPSAEPEAVVEETPAPAEEAKAEPASAAEAKAEPAPAEEAKAESAPAEPSTADEPAAKTEVPEPDQFAKKEPAKAGAEKTATEQQSEQKAGRKEAAQPQTDAEASPDRVDATSEQEDAPATEAGNPAEAQSTGEKQAQSAEEKQAQSAGENQARSAGEKQARSAEERQAQLAGEKQAQSTGDKKDVDAPAAAERPATPITPGRRPASAQPGQARDRGRTRPVPVDQDRTSVVDFTAIVPQSPATRTPPDDATRVVSGLPPAQGFTPSQRPPWNPMSVRPAVRPVNGITVFGTTLTRRQAVVGAAIVLTFLLLVGIILVQAFGQDDEKAGGTPPVIAATGKPSPGKTDKAGTGSQPAAPSSAPSSAPAAAGVPASWKSKSFSGFSLALPPGAEVGGQDGGTRVEWSGRLLLVFRFDGDDDPLKTWESTKRPGGYQKIGLGPVTYQGRPAADWEYYYNTGSSKQRVLKRGFSIDGKTYQICWYTTPEEWDAARKDLDAVFAGFKAG
jgi:serine/threonine protein kinase